jgi:glycosyltransferase involved in cell wall biosynthesis
MRVEINPPQVTPPGNPAPACVSVVIPAFNEGKTIAGVIRTVLEQPLVMEVIVVDDGSHDETWTSLQPLAEADPRIKLFQHSVNQGKGAALRTGFSKATAPFVIVQDADLEYDPADYGTMARPIREGRADVVIGTRFAGTGAHRVLYFWHYVGNKFLTLLSNMATNLNLTDMETGYKMFRREVIQKIQIEENRFGFEPEIVAKVSRMNLRIYEVSISYNGRTYAEGKKIGWRDGFSALRCIFVYNFLR